MDTYDLCIVGAGSGGIGAALAASRAGLRVALIERALQLGGNAVIGGVHNWEPGVGGDVFPREIYERLAARGDAAVWSFGRHCCWPGGERFPGGETVPDPGRAYADTQQRHGSRGMVADEAFCREKWHGVVFEPDAYSAVVAEMLTATGACDILKGWRFVDAHLDGARVSSVTIQSDDGVARTLNAAYFVDSTADGRVCRSVGCDVMRGEESVAEFGEPGAPDVADPDAVNAVTLIYRVSPTSAESIEPLGDGYPRCPMRPTWPAALFGHYPNGDINVNMLPTMDGAEFLRVVRSDGYAAAYRECALRVRGHWCWLQTEHPEFRRYRLAWIAPTLGVRESARVRGEYVLTEHDVRAGLSGQRHPDIVAVADHALDIHGERSKGIGELAAPYGVPYRCLLPLGLDNVAVACQGASFSHIAASSCRLSRTMMDLGHAAGRAVSLAVRDGLALRDVPSEELRDALRADGARI